MERPDRYAATSADRTDDGRLDINIVEIADRLREICAALGSTDRLFALADQLADARQYDQARGVTANGRAAVATASEVMAVEIDALLALARVARRLTLDLANERAAISLRVVAHDDGRPHVGRR